MKKMKANRIFIVILTLITVGTIVLTVDNQIKLERMVREYDQDKEFLIKLQESKNKTYQESFMLMSRSIHARQDSYKKAAERKLFKIWYN